MFFVEEKSSIYMLIERKSLNTECRQTIRLMVDIDIFFVLKCQVYFEIKIIKNAKNIITHLKNLNFILIN